MALVLGNVNTGDSLNVDINTTPDGASVSTLTNATNASTRRNLYFATIVQ